MIQGGSLAGLRAQGTRSLDFHAQGRGSTSPSHQHRAEVSSLQHTGSEGRKRDSQGHSRVTCLRESLAASLQPAKQELFAGLVVGFDDLKVLFNPKTPRLALLSLHHFKIFQQMGSSHIPLLTLFQPKCLCYQAIHFLPLINITPLSRLSPSGSLGQFLTLPEAYTHPNLTHSTGPLLVT